MADVSLVKTIRITSAEFRQLCELFQKHRLDWPAVFSTNRKGDIWGFQRSGPTPEAEREYLNGCSGLLDQVAGVYSEQRVECGRFFVDHRGVFYKPQDEEFQFVKWDSGAEKLEPPVRVHPPESPPRPQPTWKELQDRVRAARTKNLRPRGEVTRLPL